MSPGPSHLVQILLPKEDDAKPKEEKIQIDKNCFSCLGRYAKIVPTRLGSQEQDACAVQM